MSLRNTGLVSIVALAVAGATAACGSEAPTGRNSFAVNAGSGAGTGTGGTGGGGGAAGSIYAQGGASGGFILPDSSIQQDSGGTVPTQKDAACAADERDSSPVRKDIIVVFDNSSSMKCDTADQGCPDNSTGEVSGMSRIGAVRNAITDFVNAPASADIRVGLDCFPPADPLAEQCGKDYSQLDVPIAAAKDNTSAFAGVLGLLTPHLNTPTEQVLTGAYKAAKDYLAVNGGRSVAIVLVTDGMPFACNNDKTGAISAGLAKAAFEGSPDPVTKLPTAPSIETYVVGMGNVATLAAIASAGSGGKTPYIEANADATQKILDLLKAVSTMITCEYTIPTAGQKLDYGLVNVQAKVGAAGTVDKVYKVTGASQCAAAKGGWYYDVEPTATVSPTKVVLCSETCDPLKATEGSTLQVLIGCATQPAIIY
jgi:hypothetical protein